MDNLEAQFITKRLIILIGVLYAKDLLAHLNKKTFQWQKLTRTPFFVSENKKLDDLLGESIEKKTSSSC